MEKGPGYWSDPLPPGVRYRKVPINRREHARLYEVCCSSVSFGVTGAQTHGLLVSDGRCEVPGERQPHSAGVLHSGVEMRFRSVSARALIETPEPDSLEELPDCEDQNRHS